MAATFIFPKNHKEGEPVSIVTPAQPQTDLPEVLISLADIAQLFPHESLYLPMLLLLNLRIRGYDQLTLAHLPAITEALIQIDVIKEEPVLDPPSYPVVNWSQKHDSLLGKF